MATKFGTREKCEKCQKSVYQDDRMTLDGKILHASCFRCAQCNTKLSTANYAALEGSYFCKPHFKEQFKLKGRYDFGHKEEGAPAATGSAPVTAPATAPATAPTTAPVTKPVTATPAPVKPVAAPPAKGAAPEPKKAEPVKPAVTTPAPAPVKAAETKPAPPAATSTPKPATTPAPAVQKPAETKPAPAPAPAATPAPKPTPTPTPAPAPVAEAPKVTPATVAAVKAEISAIDWAKVDLAKLEALVNKVEALAGGPAAATAPAPPASSGAPAPPPPPAIEIPAPAPAASSGGAGMDAVFEAIKAGNVTSGLKKVTKEMKSKNNPNKSSIVSEVGSKKATTVKKGTEEKMGTPRVELVEKKWVIEYQVGNKEIVLDNVELKHTVYIYGCKDSLIQIKGKVNSIAIDKCTKTSVIHEAIVAAVEVVNCKSIQIQCNDAVPTVSIDKTDGAHIYLTAKSLEAQIVTSKSSEMNVSVPNAEDDYDELPVPEQYISTYDKPSKKLQTVHVSHI